MKIYCHGRPVALQCMDLNMVNREYPDLPKHRLSCRGSKMLRP